MEDANFNDLSVFQEAYIATLEPYANNMGCTIDSLLVEVSPELRAFVNGENKYPLPQEALRFLRKYNLQVEFGRISYNKFSNNGKISPEELNTAPKWGRSLLHQNRFASLLRDYHKSLSN
jgi:hypothetical protein